MEPLHSEQIRAKRSRFQNELDVSSFFIRLWRSTATERTPTTITHFKEFRNGCVVFAGGHFACKDLKVPQNGGNEEQQADTHLY